MVLLLVLALALASSAKRVYPEFNSMLSPDAGWVVASTTADPIVPLTVALRQRNSEKLQQFFDVVSDPRSPHYGTYKTLAEVRDLVAPSAADVKSVIAYFEAHGMSSFELLPSGDFLKMRGRVSAVNEALATDMTLWRNKDMKKAVWRALAPYSLPAEVAALVDFVSGVHHFPQTNKPRFFSPDAQFAIGPNDLRTRYNVTDFAVASSFNNTQAVAEFQGQYFSPQDLAQFFSQYQANFTSVDTVAGIVGPNSGAPGVEAELDIQYIMGVNPGAPTYFYSQSSFDFWSDLTNWIGILNSDPKPPLVHSISYGEQAEHQTSEAYKTRFDKEMQKLGSRGLSIIFASGDSGTGCSLCYRFDPSFPATSPSLTSVGATEFQTSSGPVTPGTPEQAVSEFGSGGGFSWTFDRPSYQNAAVGSYLSNHSDVLPAKFHWRPAGRGTPDVAALGIGFSVVVSGGVELVGGTSASAPTFAAIVSLLNGQQLRNGRPPLGFLNPWLYQSAARSSQAFYDVTQGNNAHGCCVHGFPATTGWDAVTGLGTPNYRQLKSMLP